MPRILTDRDPGDETSTVRDVDVFSWRLDRLEEAGYPPEIAVALAERADVDLHEAIALLQRGATVFQARRILL